MRLAVFSDIHGNLPALEAVLAAIDTDRADAIWYAGDFVGYGTWPEECVQTIKGRRFPSVFGNYDEKTLKYPKKAKKWERTKDPRKLGAFRHAFERLSDDSRAYLAALPETFRREFDGCRVLMTHSAPDSPEFGISPLTPTSRLRDIALDAEADVILTGHTHWPFIRRESDVLFVNPGSAGRPGDGDPRASYALIQIEPNQPPEAEIRRVDYSIERVIAALAETPELSLDFAALYRDGRSTF